MTNKITIDISKLSESDKTALAKALSKPEEQKKLNKKRKMLSKLYSSLSKLRKEMTSKLKALETEFTVKATYKISIDRYSFDTYSYEVASVAAKEEDKVQLKVDSLLKDYTAKASSLCKEYKVSPKYGAYVLNYHYTNRASFINSVIHNLP